MLLYSSRDGKSAHKFTTVRPENLTAEMESRDRGGKDVTESTAEFLGKLRQCGTTQFSVKLITFNIGIALILHPGLPAQHRT